MPHPLALARSLPALPRVPVAGAREALPGVQPVLDGLLEQVLREVDFPVASLTLVLHGVQAWSAGGLLREDPTGERTERAYAFCRCVGVCGAPLLVHDALEDVGLPTALAERHGVRAYAGFPVRLHGGIAGTLAVVDALPHRLLTAERRALESLARLAERRLELLVHRRG